VIATRTAVADDAFLIVVELPMVLPMTGRVSEETAQVVLRLWLAQILAASAACQSCFWIHKEQAGLTSTNNDGQLVLPSCFRLLGLLFSSNLLLAAVDSP
jgi:hypothetical protein